LRARPISASVAVVSFFLGDVAPRARMPIAYRNRRPELAWPNRCQSCRDAPFSTARTRLRQASSENFKCNSRLAAVRKRTRGPPAIPSLGRSGPRRRECQDFRVRAGFINSA
jgi:hypothetical protein